MVRRSAIAVTAAVIDGSGATSNCEMNRAARNMRNGSSLNDSSADKGVRNTRAMRSARPPNGSTSTGVSVVSSNAIALMVKSRRDKSVSMSVANCTSGLRESGE